MSFPNTKAGENHVKDIIGGGFPGDFADGSQRVTKLPSQKRQIGSVGELRAELFQQTLGLIEGVTVPCLRKSNKLPTVNCPAVEKAIPDQSPQLLKALPGMRGDPC